ncbi:MAG: hypothetical protein ACD_62C00167G0001 [uncultured bacterium]|nr:MAG: hypothetical protein ACD_62C00167G0001 [uncultured bacterium]HLD43909.1 hypothetical protein [bacterium]
MIGSDFGKCIPDKAWQADRHQRRTRLIPQTPVTIKNKDGSFQTLQFADYNEKLDFHHKLAFVVDGHAQIFSRRNEHDVHLSDDSVVAIDAIDPTEFQYIVDDFDGDGDDDVCVAFATEQKWNHEQVELMTFENDGYGKFARVGFNPKKNAWGIASARCYNGMCFWEDAPKTSDISNLRLKKKPETDKAFEVSFDVSDKSSTTNAFSLFAASSQIDSSTFVVDHQMSADFLVFMASYMDR